MKKITIIKTCTLSSLLIILVNCGGNSDSSSVSTPDSIEQKGQRVQVQTTSIPFGQASSQGSTQKMQGKVNQKLESGFEYNCTVSGTFYYETGIKDDGTFYEGFDNSKCRWKPEKNGNIIEENGISIYTYKDNEFGYIYKDYTEYIDAGSDKTKYNKNIYYSYSSLEVAGSTEDNILVYFLNGEAKYINNGNLEETYSYKKYGFASIENLVHIEGKETIKTPCSTVSNFYENYNNEFNILTKHNTKPDYYESGIIVINGFKYDYDGEYVTISKGDKVETINQALLQPSTSTSCSQKVAFSYEKVDAQKFQKGEYLNDFKKTSAKLKAYISKREMKK